MLQFLVARIVVLVCSHGFLIPVRRSRCAWNRRHGLRDVHFEVYEDFKGHDGVWNRRHGGRNVYLVSSARSQVRMVPGIADTVAAKAKKVSGIAGTVSATFTLKAMRTTKTMKVSGIADTVSATFTTTAQAAACGRRSCR